MQCDKKWLVANAGVGVVWLTEVASSEVTPPTQPKSEFPNAKPLRIRERALPGRVLAEPGLYNLMHYSSAFAPSDVPPSSGSSSARVSSSSPGLSSSYTPTLAP